MTDRPIGEDGSVTSSEDDQRQASSLEDAALLERIKRRFREARSASSGWRKEAREDYGFYSGEQWASEDIDVLKEQMRPVITFNRVAPTVDTVGGMEVNNRQEIRCYPRVASGGDGYSATPRPNSMQNMPGAAPQAPYAQSPQSSPSTAVASSSPAQAIPNGLPSQPQQPSESDQAECLSNAIKWVRDECDAEDEESDMFMDSVICGMGWTDTRLDYEVDPDGMLIEERVDPLEMFWDPYARKRNLSDARFVFRRKEIDVTEAQGMFPKITDVGDLHASWASPEGDEQGEPHDQTEARKYNNDQTDKIEGKRKKVTIVQAQWIEKEPFYRTVDLKTGTQIKLSEDEFATAKERVAKLFKVELPGVRQTRKTIKQAFVGAKVLSVDSSLDEEDFTFQCVTGKRDRNKKQWYGIVRAMKDPQRWANKFFSTILHTIATSGKGIIAERDAFVNPRDAENDWPKPDQIVWAKSGAVSGEKIMPKPASQLPAGLPDMLTFALQSLRDVSGINLEMMGQVDKDIPIEVAHQRRQSAFSILASFFDGLRHYRKRQGRLLARLIQSYISDGRLMRVETDNGTPKYYPLNRDPRVLEYDMIVDDAPSSPNQKEQVWSVLEGLLPKIAGLLSPEMWAEIIKQSPLPASFANKLVEIIQNQAAKGPPPDPKMMLAQAQIQALQSKTQIEQQSNAQELQLKQQEHQMDMQQTQEKGRVEMQIQGAQAQQEAETEKARLQHDLVATAVETKARMALETQESQNDMALERMKVEEGLKLKKAEFEEKKRQGAYKPRPQPKGKK